MLGRELDDSRIDVRRNDRCLRHGLTDSTGDDASAGGGLEDPPRRKES
jgi:hypothetical protein